jgi:uncharacterized protein YgiM (DUF1202 family)
VPKAQKGNNINKMRILKISILYLFVFLFITYFGFAQEIIPSEAETKTNNKESRANLTERASSDQTPYLFQGEINADNINIRSDSTITSEVICRLNKDDIVDVSSELYDWYKIKLPKEASLFIKKEFVAIVNEKTAKVSKDNVNLRLRPDISAPILGKVNKDEAVNIIGDNGEWYKIEAVANSFGWVHKNFLNKVDKKARIAKYNESLSKESIVIEGRIRAKTFTRIATHKLISKDNDKVYLLKGDTQELASLNNRMVKINGRLVDPAQKKYPIVEIEKIEALD